MTEASNETSETKVANNGESKTIKPNGNSMETTTTTTTMTQVSKDVKAEGSNGTNENRNSNNPNSNGKGNSRTDQNDDFSLKVKAEYIATSRPTSLGDLILPAKEDLRDDRDNKKKRGKKNKKRARDNRASDSEKICLSTIRGDDCPYGTKCKFSHDLAEFLKTRPSDITTVEGGCPTYNEAGYCPFGAMCRLGSTHILQCKGENQRNPNVTNPPPPVRNVLSKDVQIQLRKKKYPFKHKRFSDKVEDNKEDAAAAASKQTDNTDAPSSTTTENSTPYPLKERKLIDFSNKIYVAPLTTVGNLPFRRIMKKFGADITCGEMALTSNLLEGKASEWALLKRHPEEDIFGIQLAAGFPDQFIRTCEIIEAQMDVDFVDLNLGCPLDLVCNKGAGAALMMRDKRLKASLEGITQTLTCPITVKMRTGWDMDKPFAHKLVAKIQSWNIDGINSIMVHGRSRLQRYGKVANWDYIGTVAKTQDPDLKPLTIIGNGDIFSYTDYEEKIAREGVSATAMLARGALIKPWLPTEIKERRHWDISATERLDILKDFVKFGLLHWGSDQQGVDNTRRFLLEWLSFLHRYVPVGLLEVLPQAMNMRPPSFVEGRNDLETLFLSSHSQDWIKISEMLLGPVPEGFRFDPKHKARGYA